MSARTFDELFEPQIRLSLVRTPSGWHSVIDQHGSLYFPPTRDIEVCLRFMAAMASKRQAVVDDESVERAVDAAIGGWSVRVPAVAEREDGTTAAVPSRSANVVPIRRLA